MQVPSVENVFARAWDLLTRNWVIIVPGIVVGLVVGIIDDLFGTGSSSASGPGVTVSYVGLGAFASGLIVAIVRVAGYIVTQCYTAGMAGAAWQRGTTTLSDGSQAVHEDAGNVFVAAILLFVLGVIAWFLALPTLTLSIFVFYLFTLYTIAAAVVGNHSGPDALRESFAIARARFGTTLIIAVLLGLLQFLGSLVAVAFSFAPLLGPIISAIISQIVVAYAVLVVVGEYLVLRPGVTGPTPGPPSQTV